jgi:transposase-like protein
MALKVASMEELKLEVLLEPERTGETVGEVCERHGCAETLFTARDHPDLQAETEC